ncbi:hypothetical protein BHE74_00000258 [Ensete ventricosum]|nr:hypothetical protein BHE74_00000258 [Ensete ventricosum]
MDPTDVELPQSLQQLPSVQALFQLSKLILSKHCNISTIMYVLRNPKLLTAPTNDCFDRTSSVRFKSVAGLAGEDSLEGSPFVQEIQDKLIPSSFRLLALKAYDGSFYLTEHVTTFRALMALYGTPSTLMCSAFPINLGGQRKNEGNAPSGDPLLSKKSKTNRLPPAFVC